MRVENPLSVEFSQPSLSAAVEAAEKDTDTRQALKLQYQTLVTILTYIFQEFWQTNAFFTTASSVALASWVLNWERYQASSWYACIGLSVLLLFFLSLWWLSVSRHREYIRLHMQHARELEELIPGLELYHRRAQAQSTHRMSVTQAWRAAPLIMIVSVLTITVYRFV